MQWQTVRRECLWDWQRDVGLRAKRLYPRKQGGRNRQKRAFDQVK
jgi:hypothetical protein